MAKITRFYAVGLDGVGIVQELLEGSNEAFFRGGLVTGLSF